VIVEGESGLLATQKPWNPCTYYPSKSRIVWKSGTVGILRSADEPEGYRGIQFGWAWLDELGAWKKPEHALELIEPALRLGRYPRMMVTTTPRPIKAIRDMVETTLRGADRTLPIKRVHAKHGKRLRAEPVAALYEQGRVSHVGVLGDLEAQLVNFAAEGNGYHDDRVDALVYALTELMLEGSDPVARWRAAT